jgi:hypothetical protein
MPLHAIIIAKVKVLIGHQWEERVVFSSRHTHYKQLEDFDIVNFHAQIIYLLFIYC